MHMCIKFMLSSAKIQLNLQALQQNNLWVNSGLLLVLTYIHIYYCYLYHLQFCIACVCLIWLYKSMFIFYSKISGTTHLNLYSLND